LAWAQTYLKGMGLLTNSKRGVWTVTQEGQAAAKESIEPLRAEFAATRKKASKKQAKQRSGSGKLDVGSELDQVEAEAEGKWKDELLKTLLAMSPIAFERLAQRLLRESDFSSVVVTGRAGEGGIDGPGVTNFRF
jgi:restriction system protein